VDLLEVYESQNLLEDSPLPVAAKIQAVLEQSGNRKCINGLPLGHPTENTVMLKDRISIGDNILQRLSLRSTLAKIATRFSAFERRS
jgi:hypothetical protein